MKKPHKAIEISKSNEILLNEALKMANLGTWEFNVKTQKTIWSDEVFNLYALPIGEVPCYDDIMSFYIDGYEDVLRNAVIKCINEKEKYDLELRFLNANNEKLWVRAMGFPVLDDIGQIKSIRGIIQDITDFKNNLLKIEQHEVFLDALLENIADGIIACDENGELAFFNIAAREWHEIEELERHEGEWAQNYNLYYPDSITPLNKDEDPLVKAFNNELVQNQEVVIKTKEGLPRYVLASGSPIYNKKHEKLGAVIVLKDISQLKSSESEAWSLFEHAAIQIWIEDFSEVKKYLELLKDNNVSDFDAYFTKNPDELETIASLVKIINVNKKSLEFFGVKNKEVLVKNLNNFFTEASYAVFKEEIIALANGETTFTSEITIRDLNGEDAFLIVSLTVSPMFEDTFSRVLVSFLDITRLKKADLEIKIREEKYRLLADNSKDLICLHEPDGRFIYLSPSIDFLVGYDQSELVGTNPYDIIHESDIDQVKKEVNNNLVQKKNFVSVTYRVKNKSGKDIWFETLINPIIKNGELIRIVSSSRDVTNNVEHNREIENYQHSLQSLTKEISLLEERQKKAIAANIHDHMSQSLVISKMKLSELEKIKGLNKYLDDIKFIKHHISEALENSRKITYELSPPVLYQLGIELLILSQVMEAVI